MIILRFVAFLLFIISAGSVEGKSMYVAAGEDDSRQSAVSIVQRADHAAMTIMISSDEKEPADQFQELSNATRAVEQEARTNLKTVVVHAGPVHLASEAKSSVMKVSSPAAGSSAAVHLLYPLSDTKDVYLAARELTLLAKGLKASGKVSYQYSSIRLVVVNPEKYRSKLLQMIFEDLKQVRAVAKKSGKVVITGLENPVAVRQVNDTQVELYIRYSVSMELPAEQ